MDNKSCSKTKKEKKKDHNVILYVIRLSSNIDSYVIVWLWSLQTEKYMCGSGQTLTCKLKDFESIAFWRHHIKFTWFVWDLSCIHVHSLASRFYAILQTETPHGMHWRAELTEWHWIQIKHTNTFAHAHTIRETASCQLNAAIPFLSASQLCQREPWSN